MAAFRVVLIARLAHDRYYRYGIFLQTIELMFTEIRRHRCRYGSAVGFRNQSCLIGWSFGERLWRRFVVFLAVPMMMSHVLVPVVAQLGERSGGGVFGGFATIGRQQLLETGRRLSKNVLELY